MCQLFVAAPAATAAAAAAATAVLIECIIFNA